MAKRARDSKIAAAKQAQPGPQAPEIMELNPQSFIDGETYTVGVGLRNFARVRAAYFSESSPLAAFSNTNVFTPIPAAPAPPQNVLFMGSAFSYTGRTPSTAHLTVTVVSGTGTPVSKTFEVKFYPKGSVAPIKAQAIS